MQAFVTLMIWLLGISLTTLIAKKRGLDVGKWFALSVVLLIVALPASLLVSSGPLDRNRPIRLNIALIVIAVIGLVGAVYWPQISPVFLGFNCSNMAPHLSTISEDTFGPKLLAIFDEVQVSRSNDRVECTGTAVWSNSMKSRISYQAFIDHGQWFLSYQPL